MHASMFYVYFMYASSLFSTLMESVRKDHAILPEIYPVDDGVRKFVGEAFVDFEKQIVREVFRVQKWWNLPTGRPQTQGSCSLI